MGTTIHVPAWAVDLLNAVIVDKNTMRLPVQLEGERFRVVNDIARRLGARWDKGSSLFVFPQKAEVEKMLRTTLKTVTKGPPAPPDNPPDRWATPGELGAVILDYAARRRQATADGEGERLVHVDVPLLDMCAGAGHIAGIAIATGFKVFAVEQDDNCVEYLAERLPGLQQLWHMSPAAWIAEYSPYLEDNYDEDGNLLPKVQFPAIVCHASAHELQDIVLTRALWPFVKPGGRLVTVVSGGSWAGKHIRCGNFRDWCDMVGADVWEVRQWLDADYGEINDACLFVGVKPGLEAADDAAG